MPVDYEELVLPEEFWKLARRIVGEHRTEYLTLFEERRSTKFDNANFQKSMGDLLLLSLNSKIAHKQGTWDNE